MTSSSLCNERTVAQTLRAKVLNSEEHIWGQDFNKETKKSKTETQEM